MGALIQTSKLRTARRLVWRCSRAPLTPCRPSSNASVRLHVRVDAQPRGPPLWVAAANGHHRCVAAVAALERTDVNLCESDVSIVPLPSDLERQALTSWSDFLLILRQGL